MSNLKRKSDPDRRVMQIARLIEKPLADLVSHEIRVKDMLIAHTVPDGMSVSLHYTPTESHHWTLVLHQDGKTLRRHIDPFGNESALEHAVKVIPECIGYIKSGRWTMEAEPLTIDGDLTLPVEEQ